MLPLGIHHSKQSICFVILFSRSQTRTSPTMEYISKLSLLENHLCEANPFLSAVQTNALTLLCTETDVFWLSSASAPLPACKTQVHKQILILGTWKRCAPSSPTYPRQLVILMAKTGKSGSFCFCMCLEWLLSQIPLSLHLLSQAQPGSPVAGLSTTHSPPSGACWPSCGQETPPCSPGKAGPQHPICLWTNYKTRQPKKAELVFNKVARVKVLCSDHPSKRQEVCLLFLWELQPKKQSWQKHFLATNRPPLHYLVLNTTLCRKMMWSHVTLFMLWNSVNLHWCYMSLETEE